MSNFPKFELTGSGTFTPPAARPLNRDSIIGEYVGWHSDEGYKKGIIRQWVNDTATIDVDGTIYKVDCISSSLG